MYNGIGLATPRGSGTNGYVVKNLSTVTRRPRPETYTAEAQDQSDLLPYRKPDEGILMHEKKRQIEVQCLELQLKLEDQDLAEDEVTIQVEKLRGKLLLALEEGKEDKPIKFLKPHDTHQLAHAKQFENTKMMRALGISELKYVEGAAFDRERIQQEKMLRATQIELENARKLQEAKLNQDSESDSDSDSSESDSEKRRRHRKSKKSSKAKRSEKKKRHSSPSPPAQISREALSSHAQPYVHPSRQHLQPESSRINSKMDQSSRASDVRERFSDKLEAPRQTYQAQSSMRARSTSRSPARRGSRARSISRSPVRDGPRGRATKRSISRSPIRDGPRGRSSRRSVSRSPARFSPPRRAIRRSISRSPRRFSPRGRTARRSISRSPMRAEYRGRKTRRSVSRSVSRSISRSPIHRQRAGRSVSRSPIRSSRRNRFDKRSLSRSSGRSSTSSSSSRNSRARSVSKRPHKRSRSQSSSQSNSSGRNTRRPVSRSPSRRR